MRLPTAFISFQPESKAYKANRSWINLRGRELINYKLVGNAKKEWEIAERCVLSWIFMNIVITGEAVWRVVLLGVCRIEC